MSAVGPPLLQDICLLRLADHISKYNTLAGLSEELVCDLFDLVLLKVRLDPGVLQLFLDTEHKRLVEKVKDLNLQALPPRLPLSHNPWLGQGSKW